MQKVVGGGMFWGQKYRFFQHRPICPKIGFQGHFSAKFLFFGLRKFEIAILVVKITDLGHGVFFGNFAFLHIFKVISTIKIPKKSIFPKSPKLTQNAPPPRAIFRRNSRFRSQRKHKTAFWSPKQAPIRLRKKIDPIKNFGFLTKKKFFFRFFFRFFFFFSIWPKMVFQAIYAQVFILRRQEI